MNAKSKTGLEVLQASILLGVLGDVLLRQTPWGLNAALFFGAFTAALVMLVVKRRPEVWSPRVGALTAAAAVFGIFFAWRDATELLVLDALAIVAILASLTLPSLRVAFGTSGIVHYAIGGIWSAVNAAFAPFVILFSDIEWHAVSQTGWKRHFVAVLRGVAIAAPLVLVFGALFAAADAVFQGIVEKTLNIRADLIVQHLFIICVVTWVSAGYLRGTLAGNLFAGLNETFTDQGESPKDAVPSVTNADETEPNGSDAAKTSDKWDWRVFDNSPLPRTLTLGPIEIGVSMGLINALFLLFVIIQLPYLFGGFELVQQTENLKLADYARRGFGELVAVAAIVLPVLLVSHWLLRADSTAAQRIYRVMAAIQIGLLFVIMASAAQRLFVLTGNLGYGLTTVRFYPMVFMIWLAIVFLWFAFTVLRGSRSAFAWGALWSAILVVGALHVINPDEYIVKTNIRLMREGRSFDGGYNSSLSADAVPAILEAFPAAASATEGGGTPESEMFYRLKRQYCGLRSGSDPRSWNLARWQALRAFEANGDWESRVSGCEQFRRSPLK
jgi:hypothetical protein